MYETVWDGSETLIRSDPRPVPPAGTHPCRALSHHCYKSSPRRQACTDASSATALRCPPRVPYLRDTFEMALFFVFFSPFSKTKKRFFGFRVSNRRPASCIGGQVEPRPFLEISAQDQLRSKGIKKNSRMAAVSMRSAGGRVQEPPSPHLQFRYPHCVPILMPMVLDRSHNLRMVREGRTNVTILV